MKFKNHLIFEEVKIYLTEMSLQTAIDFATDIHKGQFRKGSGEPYITHPNAVFDILKKLGIKDKVLLVSAWLHDTVEDTSATYNLIRNKFSKEIADIVNDVTSDKKEIEKMGKEEYLLQKMIKMPSGSLTLKLADRLHNTSDITDMPTNKGKKLYLQTKYILDGLRDKRILNPDQKKLVREIEKNLTKFEEHDH